MIKLRISGYSNSKRNVWLSRVTESGSYSEALAVLMDYVTTVEASGDLFIKRTIAIDKGTVVTFTIPVYGGREAGHKTSPASPRQRNLL